MKSSRRRTLASLSIALCFVFAACAPGSIDAERELEAEDAELQNFLEAPELVRGPYHDPAECPHGEAMALAKRPSGERGQCESCHNQGAGASALKRPTARSGDGDTACQQCHVNGQGLANTGAQLKPVRPPITGGGTTACASCHTSGEP